MRNIHGIQLPDDAIYLVDVDGTQLNKNGLNKINTSLCNFLRGKQINFLTNMGLGNLATINGLFLMLGDEAPMTRAKLIEILKSEYNISVDRIIIPADKKYIAQDADNRRAGDAYKDLIKPFYSMLSGCIDNGTQITANHIYREKVDAFRQLNPGDDDKPKGDALALYLEELKLLNGPDYRKPLVFFDDDIDYLKEIANVCKEKKWDVRCIRVQTYDNQPATYEEYHYSGNNFRPAWKTKLIKNLRKYIATRKTEGKYRWFDVFNSGIQKRYKTQAAQALISLLEGDQNSRLNNPNDADYNKLLAALSQQSCFGDKRLLAAIRSTQGIPDNIRHRSGAALVGSLLNRIKSDLADEAEAHAAPVAQH